MSSQIEVWMGFPERVAQVTHHHNRVLHLRDGLIVAKVEHRARRDPFSSAATGNYFAVALVFKAEPLRGSKGNVAL